MGGMFAILILLAVFIVLFGAECSSQEDMRSGRKRSRKSEEEVPDDRCRFCGKPLGGRIFCPSCGRSQM